MKLREGIDEVAELLRRYPTAGRETARSDRGVLRSIRLRRYPYVVWYGHAARGPVRELWLIRLFGARQERPSPRSAWGPP